MCQWGAPEEGPRCPPTSRRTAAPYPILKSRSFGHDKPTVRIFIICNLRREIRLVKPTTWRLEYISTEEERTALSAYRVPHRFFHFERGKSSSGFRPLIEREREIFFRFESKRNACFPRGIGGRAFFLFFVQKEWRTRRFFFFLFRDPGRTKIDRLTVSVKGDESG